MRILRIIPLIFPLYFVVGASLIDQETKTQVGTIEQKISTLADQQKKGQVQQGKLLEEQRQIKAGMEQLLQSVQNLEQREPLVVPAPPPPPAVIEFPDLSGEFFPLQRGIRSLQFLAAGLVAGLLILLLVMRAQQRRLLQQIRDMETRQLQAELIKRSPRTKKVALAKPTRPQLQVLPDRKRLSVTNVGAAAADEIRLSLGPAPSTLSERQRVMGGLKAGEQAILELQHWGAERLYGSLEYKSPLTGKFYKDQFVLRYDSHEEQFFSEAS